MNADDRAGCQQSPGQAVSAEEELHVWRAGLALAEDHFRCVSAALSQAKSARAGRFLVKEDGRRFASARGILRDVLSRYVGRPARELAFVYGPHGKPALGDGSGPSFNLSHSGDMLLIAVAGGRAVGVDVERFRTIRNFERVVDGCLSPAEAQQLRAVPSSSRRIAFLTAWTRKEAYLKALGTGMARGFGSFKVSVDPGSPPVVLRGNPSCTLRDVDRGAGLLGAVAVLGRVAWVRRFSWSMPLAAPVVTPVPVRL